MGKCLCRNLRASISSEIPVEVCGKSTNPKIYMGEKKTKNSLNTFWR
jgi:hypothetical protein